MIKTRIETKGFDFLDKYKDELSARSFKSALKKAVVDASEIVEDEMYENAPHDGGTLKRSISTRVRVYSRSTKTNASPWTVVTVTGVQSKYQETDKQHGTAGGTGGTAGQGGEVI